MVATPKPAAHADDDYVPPSFPQAHLLWHIAKKGFQAGSFGGVAVSGAVALATRNRDPGAFLRGVGYGALAGTALSTGLGAAKFTQITKEGFHDRVYRLHYNASQQRTDAFSWAGGLLGLVAAGLLLPEGGPGWAAAMVGGGGVGSVLGVLTHVATRPADQVYPNKALHELVRDD
ncbi:hypothetical protein CHLRE_02g143567v5 [Chlamydomonas reinhardtii]|uniref:Uncharacterized protein n=1 Tax=Chlamydomonas reinhardtii TaxID=3055 RepID=A0A2K3E4L7_CHLRE|nr:uncharacterized protein CHLRE_02g143567v5 [Chlamydomonas reinhardtii]PNW87730.1 hypothetical protein CHLRE_02g143567v5 [Chlamydomonas reinhardtii]